MVKEHFNYYFFEGSKKIFEKISGKSAFKFGSFYIFMTYTVCDQRKFSPSTVCTENISIGKDLELKIISN